WTNDGKIRLEFGEAGCSNFTNITGSTAINDGQWHHVAIVESGDVTKLYIDGVEDLSTYTPQDINNTANFLIGSSPCTARFEGEITDFRLWSVARTPMELTTNSLCRLDGTETGLEVYYPMQISNCGACASGSLEDATANNNDGTLLNGATTKVSTLNIEECPTCANGDITINTQPTNTSVASGAMASFTVAATGNNLSYQWAVSTDGGTTFIDIDGANTASYSFTVSSSQNNNQYICYIVNGCDVKTTTAATLTVSCAAFSLTAITGEAAPCQRNYYTYYVSPNAKAVNWSWTAPAGWEVTLFDNMIFVEAGNGSGNLEVTATDACGNTDTKTLAVSPVDIQITTQPNTQTVSEGANVNMSVAVSNGGGTTTYRWQQSTDGGLTYSDISGASTATYNIASATPAHDDRDFRCIVGNDCLKDTSSVAKLTVNCTTSSPPNPGSIIGADVICGNAVLTYAIDPVSGADTYNWTLPTGWTGTSTSNMITVTANGTGGIIKVSATNACGTSEESALEVVANPGACQGAMNFDGINDYMTAAQNGQDVDGDMTVSFWVNPSSISGLQSLIFNGLEFEIRLTSGRIRYLHSRYGGGYDDFVDLTFSNNATLAVNEWRFVTLTRDVANREISLFLDGVLNETKTWDSSKPTNPDDNTDYPLTFGAGANGLVSFFEGSLDEVKIWDAERTAAEILEDQYCKPSGTETNLLAYYNFDQGQPNGDNTGLSGLTNAASAYPAAVPFNMAMSGTASNIINGTKSEAIEGADLYCATGEMLDFSIDLPGTPTVTWTLPSGWTGTSTTETITATAGSTGGLIIAEATLSCGTVRLEKVVTNTTSRTVDQVLDSRAMDFDGTDDYISTPSGTVDIAGKSFTVEFWAKRDDTGTDDYIIDQGSSSTNNRLHIGFRSSNLFTFAFFGDDLNTSNTYTEKDWHHWACVYDKSIASGDNRFIYRDGVVVASDRADDDFNGSGAMSIGTAFTDRNFSGLLDEVRVWDSVRSIAEIKAAMFCPPACATDLLLYLPMEDGIADGNNTGLTTVTDFSINDITCTLNNFALSGTESNIVSGQSLVVEGATTVCPNINWHYSVPTIDGATSYTWSLPSGWTGSSTTNEILVVPTATGGTITCTITTPCGNQVVNQLITVKTDCDAALDLDGTDDYVDLEDDIYFDGSSFTIEAWVYQKALANWSRLMDFGNGSGVENVFFALTNGTSGEPQLSIYGAGGSYSLRSNSTLPSNEWVHLSATFDSNDGAVAMYMNGEIVASGTSTETPNNVIRTRNYIGESNWSDANANIIIDEFRIWNVARTQAELKSTMFCTLSSPPASVVAYLSFDNGVPNTDNSSITKIYDNASTNRTAVLNNFALTGTTSNFVSTVNVTRYADTDMDNFGDPNSSTTDFCATGNYVLIAGDCDDTDANINPLSEEVCGNSKDDNCDGLTDSDDNTALHFDTATDDFLSIPVVDYTDDFALEYWFKAETNTSGTKDIVRYQGASNSWRIGIWDNELGMIVNTSGWRLGNVDDGQWHHIVLNYRVSDNNIKVYMDGVQELNGSGNLNFEATAMSIGSNTGGGDNYKGSVDEVRFWDRLLTTDEISNRQLVRLVGNEADLLRYYPFDQGTAGGDNAGVSILKDKHTGGNDGTMTNFTLNGTASNWIAGEAYDIIYLDNDQDSYGSTTVWSCGSVENYITNNLDCDDTDANVNPISPEVCGNSKDDNCDGMTDMETNRALSFSGSGHRIDIPNVLHKSAFTVEMWIKVEAADAGFNYLVRWRGDAVEPALALSGDSKIAYFEGGGVQGGSNLADGQWHHVALVHNGYSGTNIRAYIDGRQRMSAGFTNVVNNTYVRIGDGFRGLMDDIRFWDAALTPEQISERMNIRLAGTETDLERYYTLDQGQVGMDNSAVTTVLEQTAAAAHGTISGFTLSGTTSNWVDGQSYPTLYLDGDMDGYGGSTVWTCGSMENYKFDNVDADDSNNAISPETADICGNGMDENGNGVNDDNTLALSFDANNDEVNLGNTLGNFGTGDFTIEASIKTTAANDYILSKRGVCGLANFWNIQLTSGGQIQMEMYQDSGGSNGGTLTGSTDVTDGNWHHFAVTRKNGILRIIVDGLQEAITGRTTDLDNTTDLLIGTNPCGRTFGGQIDELRIWNYARDINAIEDLKDVSIPATLTGLLAYYDFNHPTAVSEDDNAGKTTLTDRTGNHNGTLNNFTLDGTSSNWIGNPAVTQTWYADTDMDGYGDLNSTQIACAQPTGFVANSDDCNDGDMNINPGATEIIGNNIDDDCDGATDEESSIRWVQLANGSTNGSCSSNTNCCTQTFCYGL
ncbi:MAG: LamG-like jellyroll fold domain-containing protein, partial [Bacteroidota bacterium]